MSAEPIQARDPGIANRRVVVHALPWLCIGGLIAAVVWWGTRPIQNAHFGDDQEYLTMATSFIRHGSPDFRAGDDTAMLAGLPRRWLKTLTKKFRAGHVPYGYYESADGAHYGWHFFTYPALVAPLRAWMDGRPDAFRAHQLTNLFLFCCALLSMLQLRGRRLLFWTLTPLVFFTPVLWFLVLVHTEAFVFSLGVITLSCYLSGRPLLAIMCNSIAATQYQPLAPLSLFLCGQWLWQCWQARSGVCSSSRFVRMAEVLLALVFTAIVFVPARFYFVHFGTPNLIAREGLAGVHLISAAKFGWMFVDPNGGMLFYTPGLLLLLLAGAVWATERARTERSLWGLGLLSCVLFTMFASTCQRNWNHPTFGVSRYVLYGVAPMLLFIGQELAKSRFSLQRSSLVLAALALQLFAQTQHGFFQYRGRDAAHHSEAAVYVLSHWPALYSPPAEIFCERTLKKCQTDASTGEPLPQYLPAVWQDRRGRARKVLAEGCDPDKVLRAREWTPQEAERIRAALQSCDSRGPVYINL